MSFMMWRAPMMTQSVGVPFTAKWRSPIWRSRSGSLSESECDTPDWSCSGATTQTSSDSLRAICSQTLRPGAWMPSSLVTRMRIVPPSVFRASERSERECRERGTIAALAQRAAPRRLTLAPRKRREETESARSLSQDSHAFRSIFFTPPI